MFPTKKPYHTTYFASNLLNKFPAWMKLHNTDSIAYRFVNSIVGMELDLINSYLNKYKDYFFINKTSTNAISNLYQIELPYYLKDNIITDIYDNNIYIVNDNISFLSNPPTRITEVSAFNLSGVYPYYITGIEFFNSFPSGVLSVKTNNSDIQPSSLLYYKTNTINSNIENIPYSGDVLGIGYIGLNVNGSYDIAEPESEWSLKSKYPLSKWTDIDGNDYNTMPSGVIWSQQSFIDLETGIKTYYNKSLNNPYGSGIYHFADVELTFTPIPESIVVKDRFNYLSGVPTIIPSGGKEYFTYTSGTYTYVGFENPIPWDILPTDIQDDIIYTYGSGVPIIPESAGFVSWRLLPKGGYIDNEVYPNNGTFHWIDGSGDLSNIIRFSGGFSKYTIEYSYEQLQGISQLSSEPKHMQEESTTYNLSSLSYISSGDFYQSIPYETSLTTSNAIRIDPYTIRPGTTVYYTLTANKKINDVWENAKTTDKTIQFYKHNIGYTDNLGIKADV